MHELINPEIKKALLLGDEAVIRGAFEAGLSFVATYSRNAGFRNWRRSI